ncbi:MAG: CRTAC1 family protein [Planctomycetes bacterium]|nr:CRTAC1 family protein [Planctomycetota bacterium]
MKARTIHGDKPQAGVPLTNTFHDHLLKIMKSDAGNPEVQNRYDKALARDREHPGPDLSFSGNEANPLFHHTGAGFEEIGTTTGISRTEDSRGFVLVDLDGDGALDVVMHNFFRNPLVALLNRAADKKERWIRIRLQGRKSNRFGIGAQVTVNGRVQELPCGTGYLSGNAPELHYGLGKDELADVAIRWPSGLKEEYKRVESNLIHTFVEGDAGARRAEKPPVHPIELPAPEKPKPPLDVRALLKKSATLKGDPAPVGGPAIAVFFSTGCHACVEDLKRMGELEEQAKTLGIRLAWITLDADVARVEEEFRINAAPAMPLQPGRLLEGWATPTVYLVAPERLEKFTGRHAVAAAFAAAGKKP